MNEQQLRELYRLTANRTCSALTFVKIGMSMQSATAAPSAPAVDAGAHSVLRASLKGLANHVRACGAYEKLRGDMEFVDQAIAALTGTEAAAGEPVAWMTKSDGYVFYSYNKPDRVEEELVPLYTAPPAASGQKLTDERKAFEATMAAMDGYPFAGQFANLMWKAWQARAGLPDVGGQNLLDEQRDAIRREAIEEAVKVCEDYEADKWRLYKGRAPYTGSEPQRANPYVEGQSDGGTDCANLVRALLRASDNEQEQN